MAPQGYKRAALNEMERHQVAREIWLHVQLSHPAVIALYSAWKDAAFIYLALEWADNVGGPGDRRGSLFACAGRMDWGRGCRAGEGVCVLHPPGAGVGRQCGSVWS